MNKDELVKLLKELVQVDIDVVHTYNRALGEISDEIMHTRLQEFQQSHSHHVDDLSAKIRSLGGQPPEMTKDFKGYVIVAFATLSTISGMKGALIALKTAEEISAHYYEKAVPKDFPPDLKEIIRQHFSDEKIHLDYISNNLQAF